MSDLFPDTKPPRKSPRVMMHGDDFGYDGELVLAHMQCSRCGHDADWMIFDTETDAKRGYPCPLCNKDACNAN